ncbi:MAG: (d)CMP kinase [Nanoarchaeota archaeon]
MKITMSGTPASGKSTIAKKVAELLNIKHFSMGDFQREIAREKGITIKELGELEKKDKSIDRMVDEKQVEIGKNNFNLVIDSRLGAYFIPDSIKVFVDANPDVRAKRRFLQTRDEEKFKSIQDAKNEMILRENANRDRFLEFYNFDFLDMNNYDLTIDSTDLTVLEAAEEIVNYAKKLENS